MNGMRNIVILTKRLSVFCLLFFIASTTFAQDNTRIATKPAEKITGKFLLVPFEPKLYMSEIDMKVNQLTNWNFEQIRENFRHQLDNQFKAKLQSVIPVVSLYSDSIKMWKDLDYIYKSTSISFDDLEKPSNPNEQSKKGNSIKNGQLKVEMNAVKKFTNIKINNKELLDYLTTKYEVNYLVFVNELDIRIIPESYDVANDAYQREVVVHYTILNKEGKIIIAGLESASISSRENNPKKIVAQCFSVIVAAITTKFTNKVNPPPPPQHSTLIK